MINVIIFFIYNVLCFFFIKIGMVIFKDKEIKILKSNNKGEYGL